MTLEPLRRNARTPRERPRQWPLVVGTASMAILCVSIVMLRASAPARVVPAQLPSPPSKPAPPLPEAADDVEAADGPRAVRGTVGLSLVPPSMVQTLTDAETDELVALVNEWLASEDSFGDRPSIELRHGVVYVESEEDRGDDPPYPLAAAPEAERVCGSAAAWLRAYLRDRLRYTSGLTCDANVCSFAGQEYSPSGLVIFRHGTDEDGAEWSLAAWAQYYNAGLASEIAGANTEYVRTSLRRLAGTRCKGEPNRHD